MKIKAYINQIDSIIAAIIGFYAIHLYTKYSGVGLSPDSIMYASTATNIREHASLITFNKTPLVFFPVFYPFFLSVIQFFSGLSPIQAGAYINQFLFAFVIFITGWIVSKFVTTSRIYKCIILISVILSPGLLEVYSYLWSETLFIFETLLFVIAFKKYLDQPNEKAFLLISLITAISCITRYAGVTIIGTGCLLILLNHNFNFRKKIGHIIFYGLASISLLAANLVLNSLATGLSTGTREPSITPFTKNLYYIGTVILDWGSASKELYPFAPYLTALILIGLIGILAWKTYTKRANSYERVIIAYGVVYCLFILITASISRYERLNSRLLSPLIIPLIIGCTSWVPNVLVTLQTKLKYIFSGIAILLMLVFYFVSYQTDWQRYDDESDYGVPGYSDDDWNKSEFVKYLKKNSAMFKPGVPIVSDANEAVYLFTGMQSELLPHKFFKADVQKFYARKRYYIIWFSNLSNTELLDLKDISKIKKLTRIGGVKEGAVYYYDEKNK